MALIQYASYDQLSSEYASGIIRLNALFPVDLLRAVLPEMRATKSPSLVVGIGSITGRYPAPFMSLYAASKSFLLRWIHGLSIDEAFRDSSVDIMFHYMSLGEVISPRSLTKKPNLFCPTPEAIARAIVRVVGCGHREVIPYVWHVPGKIVLDILGDSLAAKAMGKYMNLDERKAKSQ